MIHRPLVQAAVQTLMVIFSDGQMADRAIERTLKSDRRLGSRDRRFIAETVYEVTRWWRRLNWILETDYGQHEGVIENLSPLHVEDVVKLQVALTSTDPLPDWFRINETKQAGYRDLWQSQAPLKAVEHSLPDWLEQFGSEQLGEAWPKTIKALNKTAPVFLRTNTLKMKRAQVLTALAKENIHADALVENDVGLKLKERKNVFNSKVFKEGGFEVQDGGSQQIAAFLQPEPGERVIDACAGAGGKTLHLASLMQNRGKIIALDIFESKMEQLRLRTRRAGVQIVEPRLIDSKKVIKRLHDSADRVLLDVPCTGSGVWRRNPDNRWKVTQEEVLRLNALQTEILQDYSKMVKPGGVVVYATCSVWPSENEKQVESFISHSSGEFILQDQLQISPAHSQFDGFYAARLMRVQK